MSDLQEIILAEPRGFCAGVDRAIEIVEHALVKFGAPIYVRHEIVHNRYVVADLRGKGAIFIDELDEAGVQVVKVNDKKTAKQHGISQFPGLTYFKAGEGKNYHGNYNDNRMRMKVYYILKFRR